MKLKKFFSVLAATLFIATGVMAQDESATAVPGGDDLPKATDKPRGAIAEPSSKAIKQVKSHNWGHKKTKKRVHHKKNRAKKAKLEE